MVNTQARTILDRQVNEFERQEREIYAEYELIYKKPYKPEKIVRWEDLMDTDYVDSENEKVNEMAKFVDEYLAKFMAISERLEKFQNILPGDDITLYRKCFTITTGMFKYQSKLMSAKTKISAQIIDEMCDKLESYKKDIKLEDLQELWDLDD